VKLAILISIAAWVLGASAMACGTVAGDHILAGDFAALNPAFATLDPQLPLGVTPMPAVTRVFRPDDIARLARTNGITLEGPVAEMCFARAVELLSPEKLLPALRIALAIDDAKIEILDFSRNGVPAGTLQFTRAGLNANGLWRGQLTYSQDRSVAIWVKARITTEQTWVEALDPLAVAKPITREQLVVRKGPRFPFAAAPLDSVDRAVGHAPLQSIKPGEPIFASMLTMPREVERGDTVRVEVVSGEAKLVFDATAESSGRLGELILIKNPDNGRRFQARVEEKGKVLITK